MSWPFDQGWNAIWDKTKHFMFSFFAVLCLYGIPTQWLHYNWDGAVLLVGASAITFMLGIIWELIGNWNRWDVLADLAGIAFAIILIGV